LAEFPDPVLMLDELKSAEAIVSDGEYPLNPFKVTPAFIVVPGLSVKLGATMIYCSLKYLTP
jgi:hypothetical protein